MMTEQLATSRRIPTAHRRRKGRAPSIALLVVLPILLLVLLAAIEFSLLLMSQQALAAAASTGGRVAALPSASKEAVDQAVARAVSGFHWAGATVVVLVDDVPVDGRGDLLAEAPLGTELAVTVSLPSHRAAPETLSLVGSMLYGRVMTASFFSRRE